MPKMVITFYYKEISQHLLKKNYNVFFVVVCEGNRCDTTQFVSESLPKGQSSIHYLTMKACYFIGRGPGLS